MGERAPIVIPIRFATGEAVVQTTTRQLSADGVLVRCVEPPPAGTALDLKLYLPGSSEPLHLSGVVAEHAPPDEDTGFWAEFLGASEAQRARIDDLIGRRERAADPVPIGAVALNPHDEGRRSFPRYNVNFAVRFATVQDFVLEYAANISAGGVFVHTEQPPPLKTVVQVEMELPGSSDPVPARGMVVHRVTREEADQKGTFPGVGVQFMDAGDEFRQRIDAAIAHILDQDQAA
ncbi:MAG TPA: TIGR02266 family protein [Myxococcales bacterium]|nr:TIGR02266 family protein [Myxococcales bacterium]